MRRARFAVGIAGALGVAVHAAIFLRYLPGPDGALGHDHSYFLPQMLAGSFWELANGPFAVPWFTPAFCGGVPFYPNPQNLYHSVPQFLAFAVDPLAAVRITLVAFTALGFAGCYLLLRRAFALARPAACFGAVLFAFNGYFAHRMLIGHLVFHGFALVPLMALALLGSARGRGARVAAGSVARTVTGGVAGGVGLAYLVQISDLYGVPVALAVVLALWLVQGLRGQASGRVFARLAVAGLVALALSAAKVNAMLAFLASFPRDAYPLPGAPSFAAALRMLAAALFHLPPVDAELVNVRWPLERHEREFGVSPVAGAALVLGAVACARGLPTWAKERGVARTAAGIALLALVCTVPVLLNVHDPEREAWIKGIPLLASSSNLLRWFSFFVPLCCVLAALALECLPARARLSTAALASVAAILWHAGVDRSYYAEQPYRADAVVAAWQEAHERGVPPPVRTFEVSHDAAGRIVLAMGRNDALARGASQLAAAEPIFGYLLEWFPARGVRAGAALQERDGGLNVKNPACMLFPRENGCEPGDAFRGAERRSAEAFLAYRPFPFRTSGRQRVANAVNLVAVVVVLLGPFVAFVVHRRTRRARGP